MHFLKERLIDLCLGLIILVVIGGILMLIDRFTSIDALIYSLAFVVALYIGRTIREYWREDKEEGNPKGD